MGSTKEKPFQILRKVTDKSSTIYYYYYYYYGLLMSGINFSFSTDVGNTKYLSYVGSVCVADWPAEPTPNLPHVRYTYT